jgi:catalase
MAKIVAGDSGEFGEAVYGDERVQRGHGGETHQQAGDGRPSLTTQQGVVVADDQNSLRVGEPGRAGRFPLPGENLPFRS